MASSKTFLLVLPLLLLANKVVSQEDTTIFNYNSFNTGSRDTLIFQGDAFHLINFVRLTRQDTNHRPARFSTGRVVYAQPVKFWEAGAQASFETTITFSVRVGTTTPPGVGNGVNFFMVPVNSPIPPGSGDGNLGLFNPQTGGAPSVFAVEFDVTPDPWDPDYPHLGIDINSRVSRNVTRLANIFGRDVTAHITYVSSTRTISVVATYGSFTSTVSYVIDLKTILPRLVHVGISATTGESVALHDVRAWSFISTLVSDSNSLGETHVAQYV